jgi:D-tyrosyl-tRNA(Tyr) deacylase
MRAVVQRVRGAEVRVDGTVIGRISGGLLVYIGVEAGDTETDLEYIASKIAGLRIFPDADGKMNCDVKEADGELLIVSQFTLSGDARKGRRPSFKNAEEPEKAKQMYESLVERLRDVGLKVETGEFRAHMEVESINDGPVTLLLESKRLF